MLHEAFSAGIWKRLEAAAVVVAPENTVDVYVGQLTSGFYVYLNYPLYFETCSGPRAFCGTNGESKEIIIKKWFICTAAEKVT